jgi:hypothetical protein
MQNNTEQGTRLRKPWSRQEFLMLNNEMESRDQLKTKEGPAMRLARGGFAKLGDDFVGVVLSNGQFFFIDNDRG